MNQPFVKIDLHGLRQEEAREVIEKAIRSASPMTYHLQLIHGYHRGTSLRTMKKLERVLVNPATK
ncbi:MAG: Smr/MutS family protein, partial [Lachnospiraceae bacterium]|nr:Smr/MutS family protein [Lachnospiraceae bacterium]